MKHMEIVFVWEILIAVVSLINIKFINLENLIKKWGKGC